MEKRLTNEQIETISGAIIFSPVFSSGDLTCFKIGPKIIFNNSGLSMVMVNVFAVLSGEQLFYDVVRKDRYCIDVDRHLMNLDRNSASGAFIQSDPIKDFNWHHNPPKFYLN